MFVTKKQKRDVMDHLANFKGKGCRVDECLKPDR